MSKELILSIETSTAMCSVALSSEGKVLEHRSDSLRRHASLTSVFCKEVLDAAGVSPRELSAVCISDGPGSYTGLRVGLSTAKGICFGAGVKLLSVSSLDVLAAMAANAFGAKGIAANAANASAAETIAASAANESRRNVGFGSNALGGVAGFCPNDALGVDAGSCPTDALSGNANASAAETIAASAANESGRNVGFGSNALGVDAAIIVPMIDARRMEVFCARYDATGLKRLSEVEAVVVDEKSFADIAPQALFIGDGAMKCREVIGAGQFVEACPDAAAMAALAHREYAAGNWRDVAYFEPFYLKEFVATVSKKKLF